MPVLLSTAVVILAAIAQIQLAVQQADTLRAAGRYQEAESVYCHALDELPWDGELGALVRNQLGLVLLDQGRPREAESILAVAFQTRRRLLGNGHRDTLVTAGNLASAYQAEGHLDRAVSAITGALDAGAAVLSPREMLLLRRNLAYAYLRQGNVARAEPIVRANLAAAKELFGPRHINTAIELNNMAEVLRADGRYTEATQLFREALEVFDQAGAREHPLRAQCAANLQALTRKK